jgi:hypothetical protein
LWFAFYKEYDVEARSVWLLKLANVDIVDIEVGTPYDQTSTKAFKPNHITRRITAQNGWFTTHKFIEDKLKKFIPLNRNRKYTG